MKVKTLLKILNEAIESGGFSPNSNVQIDIGDDTYWDMSVDVSAVSEPRAIILNLGD